MPGQEGLRRDDAGNLLESAQAKALRLLSKPPPLIIAEPQALLALPRWVTHKRMLVRKLGKDDHGINRRGLIVALPQPKADAALYIPIDFLIDGEAVGDVLHAFDLLQVKGTDVGDRSYIDRFVGLLRLLDATSAIRPVSTVVEPKDKQAMLDTLRTTGAEGVVFKDMDSHFKLGRPNSGGPHLKFKFVATASFIVGAINQRRSVASPHRAT